MIFDNIDKKLLEHLQKDSKQTNKELSNKLGLSVTAVYERIKKLEREGFIDGYTVLVNKEKIQKNFLEDNSKKEMTIDDFDRSLNLAKLYCLSKGKKNMLLEDYEFIRILEKNGKIICQA